MLKKILLLAVLIISMVCQNAQGQSSAELKKKQADIQREIDDLREQLNQTKKYKKKSLSELNLVQKRLRLRESQIKNINDQINLIQGNINQSWRDIVKLRSELDTLKLQYEKSVVYAYKNRSNYDFLNFIFSSGSFNDALKRVAYLKSYRAYREQQAASIRNTQTQLQQKIAGLNQNKVQKSQALDEQNKQFRQLEEEKKEKDAVVREIKGQEKELTADMNRKRKQDIQLKNAISAAIRREIEAERRRVAAAEKERKAREAEAKKDAAANPKDDAAANASKPSNKPADKPAREVKPLGPLEGTEENKLLSDNFEKNQNKLPWPISAGRIAMKFGPVKYEGLDGITYNNPGITIEADAGSSVKAVFDGEVSTVISIGQTQGVILKHGKYFTTYSNLSSVNVGKGQQVKTGQVIGRLDEKDGGRGELEFLITNDKNVNLNPESWLR
ncbi:murein hydrolase activator EnvC family protein [Flavihumibacter fluvii]|uniref:murein hydrolase activator EnvC family protein n=1 Tax=Flavihumibacter fluvii TaxID=2838157 RepID=UPI001BDEFE30|nr:peptidoglycan DD-metalloendopeptidase family protein [Flavihumibacter fluvii]ULQ51033.1 peptidoglycan DD-metalloendopeptidase family protein [Flavihumibacter fluvii]